MRSSRGLLHNLGILGVGQVLSQLLNVWALVYLAGRLGAHWFGVVQVGVAVMGYALVAAEGGLFALGVREASRIDEPAQLAVYARRHVGLLALQAAGILGLGLLLIPLLPFGDVDPWIPLLYLLAVIPQVLQMEWLATGLEKMAWVGATRIARSLVYAVLVLGGLAILDGVAGVPAQRWVPLMYVGAMAASNLVIALPARRWFGGFIRPLRPGRSEAFRRCREAAPIAASALVMRVLLNIDLMLLGILASPEAAGHYAAAARIIFLLVVAVEVLWSALLPRQSRLAALDPAGFRRSFNLYLGGVLAVLLPVAVGGRLLAEGIIGLLYSPEYADSAPVFANLAMSYSLLAVAMYLGNSLLACDRQREYVVPMIIGASVAAAATALLVPGHGAIGASWGMLAGHGLLALITAVVTRRLYGSPLGLLLASLLPALLLMALAVSRTAAFPVLARVAVGVATYGAAAAWPLRRFVAGMRRWPRPDGGGA